ncbi:MAG TPA: ABC transporter permease, partial [Vicinamibacterales bacterium]
EARRLALVKFGAVESMKEDYLEQRGVPVVSDFVRDLGYAWRLIRKAPGFSVIAVIALGIGIGVNTAVFSAFDQVALRPLDVNHPEQLVRVYRSTRDDPYSAMSYPDYLYYREHVQTISDLSILAYGTSVTSSEITATSPAPIPPVAGALGFQLPQLVQGGARPMSAYFVSGDYFRMLKTTPIVGRMLSEVDDSAAAPAVGVLSGNFWQRQFHGDRSVIGTALHLNGVPFTVVGVTPVDYVATAQNVPDLWLPAASRVALGEATPSQIADPDVSGGWVEGRLASGATLGAAQAELNALAGELRQIDPRRSRESTITVASGRTYAPGLDASAWTVVVAALVSVLLLLLIACTNVASLLLARSAVRRREIAVRLAIGAGRGRLLRQLLTECVVLAVLAGAAAVVASASLLRTLVTVTASALPEFWGTIALHTDPDWRIFAYAFVVSIVAGIAFGLTPALQASKVDLNGALKHDVGDTAMHRSRRSLLDVLVLAQVAACLVLLVSSAMLLRSSSAALHADPGFDASHVLLLQPVGAAAYRVDPAAADRFADALHSLPGVAVVARAARKPMLNGGAWMPIVDADRPNIGPETPNVPFNEVSPEYFQALGIPMVQGRTFTKEETDASAPVAVISEHTAERYFPHGALGHHVVVGSRTLPNNHVSRLPVPHQTFVVIGVAADVRSIDMTRVDSAYVYLPLLPGRRGSSAVLVRVDRDPRLLLPAVGAELRRTLPDVPTIAGPMLAMISTDPRFVVSRFGGVLAAAVALIGLVLASLGVYGMVGYNVSQRTREIGIRMALGAEVRTVIALIVRDGTRPVLWGIGAGLLLSAIASKLLASLLFGVGAFDPKSFAAASIVLVGVTLIAICCRLEGRPGSIHSSRCDMSDNVYACLGDIVTMTTIASGA